MPSSTALTPCAPPSDCKAMFCMLDELRVVAPKNQNIKKRLGKAVVRAARTVGFLHTYGSLRSRLVKQQAAILAYHRIDKTTSYPWSLTPVTPQDFEREIKYLRQKYQIISLDELSTALCDLKTIPPNTAAITIDDGYRDIYINAYPILKKYNVPATVFLTTGHISTGNLFWWDRIGYVVWKTKVKTLDLGELGTYHLTSDDDRLRVTSIVADRLKKAPLKQRDDFIDGLMKASGVAIPPNLGKELLLSWDEIREMSQNGISFGAHTVSHPILTRVSLGTAKKEILDSKRHIENELDQEVTTFCYPNGEPGDFNDDIEKILKHNGFRCAVAAPTAFVSSKAQPYRLPRITGASSFDTFELLISGLYFDLVAKCFKIREIA